MVNVKNSSSNPSSMVSVLIDTVAVMALAAIVFVVFDFYNPDENGCNYKGPRQSAEGYYWQYNCNMVTGTPG